MKLLGISTRVPSFGEVTAASIAALGLWIVACGLSYRAGFSPSRFDAGVLLVLIEWSCVSLRLGIRPHLGARHLALHVAGCALVMAAFHAACVAFV